jgi:hypothetical protein
MKILYSIFTEDMNHCYFTGKSPVERHHVFGGSNRKNSERFGFVVPLSPELHPNGVHAGRDAKQIDIRMKTWCQDYFEHMHGAREDFIKIFGKSYL